MSVRHTSVAPLTNVDKRERQHDSPSTRQLRLTLVSAAPTTDDSTSARPSDNFSRFLQLSGNTPAAIVRSPGVEKVSVTLRRTHTPTTSSTTTVATLIRQSLISSTTRAQLYHCVSVITLPSHRAHTTEHAALSLSLKKNISIDYL